MNPIFNPYRYSVLHTSTDPLRQIFINIYKFKLKENKKKEKIKHWVFEINHYHSSPLIRLHKKYRSPTGIQQKHVKMTKCNCTCKLFAKPSEHKLNLHTVVRLKVGAAGVPATYRNPPNYNTFIAVAALAFEKSYTLHLLKTNDTNHKTTSTLVAYFFKNNGQFLSDLIKLSDTELDTNRKPSNITFPLKPV